MNSDASSDAVPCLFPQTHWSLVLAASRRGSPESEAALEIICRAYWYPLYAYVRRCGQSPHDAQDLTQEFFARLLEKHWLETADREKGRIADLPDRRAEKFHEQAMAARFRATARRRPGARAVRHGNLPKAATPWTPPSNKTRTRSSTGNGP